MFNICWCTDSLRVEKFTLKMFLYCCNNWQCFSSRASTPSRHITTMHFGLFGKKRKKTCRVWVNESGRSIQCSLLRCKYTNTNAHQQETWHGLHGHIQLQQAEQFWRPCEDKVQIRSCRRSWMLYPESAGLYESGHKGHRDKRGHAISQWWTLGRPTSYCLLTSLNKVKRKVTLPEGGLGIGKERFIVQRHMRRGNWYYRFSFKMVKHNHK